MSEAIAAPALLPAGLRWVRSRARITNGTVELTSKPETFWLEGSRELVFDLSAIRRPDEIRPFVRRYGLLRRGPDSPEYRESVSGWLAESRDLATMLALAHTIQRVCEGDAHALDRLDAALRSGVVQLAAAWPDPWDDKTALDLLDQQDSLFPGTPMGRTLHVAGRLLALVLSARLGEVRVRSIEAASLIGETDVPNAGSLGVVQLFAQPPDLLSLAWYTLALIVGSRATLGTCLNCGRYFEFTRANQKFCTPRCGNTARQRRWREGRREEKEA